MVGPFLLCHDANLKSRQARHGRRCESPGAWPITTLRPCSSLHTATHVSSMGRRSQTLDLVLSKSSGHYIEGSCAVDLSAPSLPVNSVYSVYSVCALFALLVTLYLLLTFKLEKSPPQCLPLLSPPSSSQWLSIQAMSLPSSLYDPLGSQFPLHPSHRDDSR